MITIISKEKTNGLHQIECQSGRTSTWLEGYVIIPEHLVDIAWKTCGYCDLLFDENGNISNIIPTEKPAVEPVIESLTPEEERDIIIANLQYEIEDLKLKLNQLGGNNNV